MYNIKKTIAFIAVCNIKTAAENATLMSNLDDFLFPTITSLSVTSFFFNMKLFRIIFRADFWGRKHADYDRYAVFPNEKQAS